MNGVPTGAYGSFEQSVVGIASFRYICIDSTAGGVTVWSKYNFYYCVHSTFSALLSYIQIQNCNKLDINK